MAPVLQAGVMLLTEFAWIPLTSCCPFVQQHPGLASQPACGPPAWQGTEEEAFLQQTAFLCFPGGKGELPKSRGGGRSYLMASRTTERLTEIFPSNQVVPRVPGGHNRQNNSLSPGPFLPGLLGWVGEWAGLLALPGADLEPEQLPHPLQRLPSCPLVTWGQISPSRFFLFLVSWLETRPVAH